MASANDEETSLHHEERRLNLDVQRLILEERRLSLEQKRSSVLAAAANTTQRALAARPAPRQAPAHVPAVQAPAEQAPAAPPQAPVGAARPPPPPPQQAPAEQAPAEQPVAPPQAPVGAAVAPPPPPPPANDDPKILTAPEIKEAAKAASAKKAPADIRAFLKKVVPQDNLLVAMIHDVDTRSDVCNAANALRARSVVQGMEHETMLKRKAASLQDTGVEGKGVKAGKLKRVKGIPATSETALRNVSKFIPQDERHEYVYDNTARQLFCKPCSVLISRVEYLNPALASCHHLTKQHKDNRAKALASNLYQQSLVVALREKQDQKRLTTQITDANFSFRTDVVKFFMQAGVHLEVFASAMAPMRLLFNKYVSAPSNQQLRLTDASHLRETHIPLVHQLEITQILQELVESDGWISIEFDETTRNRLWWAAVFRFVLKGIPQQRLVRLAAYKHGPDEMIGCQLSSMVIDLIEHYKILRKQVIHFSRDGVAVNGAAIRYLSHLAFLLLIYYSA